MARPTKKIRKTAAKASKARSPKRKATATPKKSKTEAA